MDNDIGHRSAVDPSGFDGLDLTRKKGFVYDPETHDQHGSVLRRDCGNDKISIAVEPLPMR